MLLVQSDIPRPCMGAPLPLITDKTVIRTLPLLSGRAQLRVRVFKFYQLNRGFRTAPQIKNQKPIYKHGVRHRA